MPEKKLPFESSNKAVANLLKVLGKGIKIDRPLNGMTSKDTEIVNYIPDTNFPLLVKLVKVFDWYIYGIHGTASASPEDTDRLSFDHEEDLLTNAESFPSIQSGALQEGHLFQAWFDHYFFPAICQVYFNLDQKGFGFDKIKAALPKEISLDEQPYPDTILQELFLELMKVLKTENYNFPYTLPIQFIALGEQIPAKLNPILDQKAALEEWLVEQGLQESPVNLSIKQRFQEYWEQGKRMPDQEIEYAKKSLVELGYLYLEDPKNQLLAKVFKNRFQNFLLDHVFDSNTYSEQLKAYISKTDDMGGDEFIPAVVALMQAEAQQLHFDLPSCAYSIKQIGLLDPILIPTKKQLDMFDNVEKMELGRLYYTNAGDYKVVNLNKGKKVLYTGSFFEAHKDDKEEFTPNAELQKELLEFNDGTSSSYINETILEITTTRGHISTRLPMFDETGLSYFQKVMLTQVRAGLMTALITYDGKVEGKKTKKEVVIKQELVEEKDKPEYAEQIKYLVANIELYVDYASRGIKDDTAVFFAQNLKKILTQVGNSDAEKMANYFAKIKELKDSFISTIKTSGSSQEKAQARPLYLIFEGVEKTTLENGSHVYKIYDKLCAYNDELYYQAQLKALRIEVQTDYATLPEEQYSLLNVLDNTFYSAKQRVAAFYSMPRIYKTLAEAKVEILQEKCTELMSNLESIAFVYKQETAIVNELHATLKVPVISPQDSLQKFEHKWTEKEPELESSTLNVVKRFMNFVDWMFSKKSKEAQIREVAQTVKADCLSLKRKRSESMRSEISNDSKREKTNTNTPVLLSGGFKMVKAKSNENMERQTGTQSSRLSFWLGFEIMASALAPFSPDGFTHKPIA